VLLAGQKHPALMGQSYKDAWAEIWDEVKDVFANARITGQATMKDDDCLFMMRSNFLEETYFSWSIIPMVGADGTVAGLYNPAFEKTRRKIVERRMLTLREVGERTATARDVKGFWRTVGEALDFNAMDTPFVLLYSVSEDSDSDSSSIHSSSIIGAKQCYLESVLGVPEGHPIAPEQIELKTSMEGLGPVFREVMKTDKPVLLRISGTEEEEPVTNHEFDSQAPTHEFVTERGPEIPAAMLEGIQWRGFGDACRSVVICPVHPTTGESVLGFLVLGVNPRRPYDDDYALFIQLLSRQLATSLASVVLFEEEIRRGQRAAKLAALDRIELSEQLAARTQEARDSETRFARMAELSPAALFIANSQGQIIYCNDTWYEITRVSKDSSGTDRWIDAVSEEDQHRVRQLWTDLIEDCKPLTAEFRFKAQWHDRHGKPTATWVLFSAFPETYAASLPGVPRGKLKSVFGSLTDISQQKWAEDFQKRKMEEAVELKRQQENFIDITSHEMRNPLSAILQCADEIKTRLSEFKESAAKVISQELVDDSIEAAQTIMFCAQHQKQIVDDVLTLSKLDSHMLMVTPIDVQPLSVAERALKMHENEIKNADISMQFVVDDSYEKLGIDWVRLDPQRVLQVLMNLTGNAIKFTAGREKRVITVTIAASVQKPTGHSKQVDYFPSRRKGGDFASTIAKGADWGDGEDVYVQFAVQDTGRGLDPEEKKMLFMRFSQASPRTHIQYGGSGLGLFISRELTELQGGEIGVASEAGKGSTFAFYVRARRSGRPVDTESQFPELVKAITTETRAKRSGRAKSRDRGPAAKAAREHIVILIVEDNLVNQKVLQKQLKNIGFKVSVANHGGEALDRLKESHFWKAKAGQGEPLNIVLMDQEMPVMDGLQCTKKIREWEKDGSLTSHIPIIGVTANARAEQIQTLLVAGMVSSYIGQ
jgi:PAS domain S-box-containing protein